MVIFFSRIFRQSFLSTVSLRPLGGEAGSAPGRCQPDGGAAGLGDTRFCQVAGPAIRAVADHVHMGVVGDLLRHLGECQRLVRAGEQRIGPRALGTGAACDVVDIVLFLGGTVIVILQSPTNELRGVALSGGRGMEHQCTSSAVTAT